MFMAWALSITQVNLAPQDRTMKPTAPSFVIAKGPLIRSQHPEGFRTLFHASSTSVRGPENATPVYQTDLQLQVGG